MLCAFVLGDLCLNMLWSLLFEFIIWFFMEHDFFVWNLLLKLYICVYLVCVSMYAFLVFIFSKKDIF